MTFSILIRLDWRCVYANSACLQKGAESRWFFFSLTIVKVSSILGTFFFLCKLWRSHENISAKCLIESSFHFYQFLYACCSFQFKFALKCERIMHLNFIHSAAHSVFKNSTYYKITHCRHMLNSNEQNALCQSVIKTPLDKRIILLFVLFLSW